MVHFHLSGPAEWRGGIAQGSAKQVPVNTEHTVVAGMSATAVAPFLHEDNYILSPDLPVEGGVNRVSVRSTTVPGQIELTADSEGLTPAHVTLITQPVTQGDGVSLFDPGAGLPLQLGRGPTPEGPSFTATRKAVTIVSATAGRNPAEAMKSYDDDETTSWTNASAVKTDTDTDGLPIRHAEPDQRPVEASLQDAWIEYTLAQPVMPREIDLKLGSFRLRRYPLRITLDGEVLYEGLTPTSLGYVTLPLNARRAGTKLRIELTGLPADMEESHALVEVNGKIDQAEPKSKAAKPVLSILEAEIYTAP
jgi:beta-galactosidase